MREMGRPGTTKLLAALKAAVPFEAELTRRRTRPEVARQALRCLSKVT
jgi:hypothetical protein